MSFLLVIGVSPVGISCGSFEPPAVCIRSDGKATDLFPNRTSPAKPIDMRLLQRFAACMSITRHETAGLLREAATGDIGREGEVWTVRRGSVGRTVRQVELAFRCLAEP